MFSSDTNFKNSKNHTRHEDAENLFFISENIKCNSFLYRNLFRYFDFYQPLQLSKYLLRNYQSDEINVLLYSSHFPLFAVVLFYLKYLKKYFVIVEKNELETGIISNMSFPEGGLEVLFYLLLPYRYMSAFLIDWLTKKASGVIAISTRLREKYNASIKCTLIPVLVYVDRFKHKAIEPATQKVRFVYHGAITNKKDCLEKFFRSFNKLSSKYDYFLVDVIGSSSRHYLKKKINISQKTNWRA